MFRGLTTRLTRSSILARLLFGGRLPALAPGEHYFDATTLALIHRVRRTLPRGARVLDMGTGSAAVIGVWLWRHLDCVVTCTEVHPAIASKARATIAANGAPIGIVCCRSFAALRGDFDFVVFNPPYVPTATGLERALPEAYRSQWDGGAEGVEAIGEFVSGFSRAGENTTALVGVNRRHVPREKVLPLVKRARDVVVAEVRAHPWLPVDVYVLVRRKSSSASASSPDA